MKNFVILFLLIFSSSSLFISAMEMSEQQIENKWVLYEKIREKFEKIKSKIYGAPQEDITYQAFEERLKNLPFNSLINQLQTLLHEYEELELSAGDLYIKNEILMLIKVLQGLKALYRNQ